MLPREVGPRVVKMLWLLQAGFYFETPGNFRVLVDPYFSDAIAGLYGKRRVAPPPVELSELPVDVVAVTHWHEDHLDPGAIADLEKKPGLLFVGPPSCVARLRGRGVAASRTVALTRGDTFSGSGVTIHAVFARHEVAGFITEDAVGFVFDFDGTRIYHSGDTEYDSRLLAIRDLRPDAALVCINGTDGNMNAYEAALLVWQLGARLAVPMHVGLWDAEGYGPGATLDPARFADTYERLGGTGEIVVPMPGERIDIR